MTIHGTASGANAIQRVEYLIPGKGFRLARGTRNWSFQFRPGERPTRIIVRAVDVTSLVSNLDSVTVVPLNKKPANRPRPAHPCGIF